MRIIILAFLLSVIVSNANAQQAITTTNLNLRSAPNSSSNILCSIPQSTIIFLTDCPSVWCQTSFNGYTGYVNKSFVAIKRHRESNKREFKVSSQQHPLIRHYTNSAGERVQSPTYYNSPPVGACAECRDGTYSFSRSRRGTCSHHGGVKRWLK
jgi:uncharacterized protein YraI